MIYHAELILFKRQSQDFIFLLTDEALGNRAYAVIQ